MKTISKDSINNALSFMTSFITSIGIAFIVLTCVDEKFIPLKSNLLPISIGMLIIGVFNIALAIYFGCKISNEEYSFEKEIDKQDIPDTEDDTEESSILLEKPITPSIHPIKMSLYELFTNYRLYTCQRSYPRFDFYDKDGHSIGCLKYEQIGHIKAALLSEPVYVTIAIQADSLNIFTVSFVNLTAEEITILD